MLQRVMIDGIELPRLYIAETSSDVKVARENGIPYICWTSGQDELIRILLRPLLERMFPHIKWSKVLGRRRKFRTEVSVCETIEEPLAEVDELDDDNAIEVDATKASSKIDVEDEVDAGEIEVSVDPDGTLVETAGISANERVFSTSSSNLFEERKLSIEEYVGDMSSYVNIEILQRLRLLPAFIGDILDCVKLNVTSGIYWSEGYNKRLALPVGRFNTSRQLPNLVILDVSGSIPRGISATMITLIDTLRTQLSADLIITSSRSVFYPMGSELPDPQRIRNKFGYGNESYDFMQILRHEIRGKQYGHVFSFGDTDTPSYTDVKTYGSLMGTKVGKVHHYHTGAWVIDGDIQTGYAKWCHMLADQPEVEYNTDWCKIISDK